MKTNFIKTLFVTLFLLSVNIVNAHDFEVDGIYYNITDATNKTVAVTYKGSYYDSYYNEYTGSVVIPESVSYNGKVYSVTSIGGRAFDDCSGLTSIVIPNSVTSIEDEAFYGCSGLTSIVIPNSVTSIGDEAFWYCYGLTSIVIPDGVTSIGNEAFEHCIGLTSIVIPNSVTSIGNEAFASCNRLTSIEIPNSVTSIGDGAFAGCQGLTSIEIPNSVTSIGGRAFASCYGLTSIEIPNSVTSIGEYAFSSCSGLTSIVIPNSVTSIGERAFWDCPRLTSIVIPNSVTSIGEYAFASCYRLTSIEIPNSVTSIGNSAFNGCSGLTSIEIPNSVTRIGDEAFEGCSGLTSIVIPNSVTSIGNSAFYGSGLTSIVIPNSVTSIGNYAFYHCYNLIRVINLSNLTFSQGSSDYGYVAYYADIVINDPKATFVGDFVFSTVDDKHTLVAYLGKATEITLPDNYNGENYVIGKYAFKGCSGLTSITIPNSVTSIGYNAFEGCYNLITVINLSNLTFSQGSSDYGYVAYYADKVINAPNGGIVGDFVFSMVDGKHTLAGYLGNETEITLPDNYNGENYAIGNNVFKNKSSITSITIPNSVTSIGDYAFEDCEGLTSVTIGNSVTSIGESAFYKCTNLKRVIIPCSVSNINENVFEGCNLKDMVILSSKPLAINENFYGRYNSHSNITLHIPYGSASAYKSVAIWNEFANYVEFNQPNNPSHQPVELYMPDITGAISRWEYSRDNGETWTNIECEEYCYTETDPEPGKVLYRVLKSDGVYSNILTINYYDPVPEIIVTTPTNETKTVDESIIFALNVKDDGYTYQWMFNNVAIEGATNSRYSIPAINMTDAGEYFCVVSNPVSCINSTSSKLTVNKCPQIITFPEIETKTFGDEAFTLPATTDKGLTINYQSTNTNVATVDGNIISVIKPGVTVIKAIQNGNKNYLPAQSIERTLIVNKAEQKIEWYELPAKKYGDDDFALPKTTDKGLTISYTSDNEDVATINGNIVSIKNAGSTNITATQSGDDYYNAATAVTQILTASKITQSITFEELPVMTFGDTPIELNATASSSNEVVFESSDETVATISGKTLTVVGAGSCIITASCAGDNNYYTAIPVERVLVVNKARQTITIAPVNGKRYGDEPFELNVTTNNNRPVVLTSSDASVLSIKGTTATIRAAGNVTITALQEATDEYEKADTQINVVINKATLTASVPNIERTYGEANPKIEITYSGFVNDETKEDLDAIPVATCSATELSRVGEYDITISRITDKNYILDIKNAKLKIKKAILSVAPDNVSKIYGDKNPTLSVTYSGFKNNENEAVLLSNAVAFTKAKTMSDVGEYIITTEGASAVNYDFEYKKGVLVIQKAPLAVLVEDIESVYGAIHEHQIKYEGFKGDDDISTIDVVPNIVCDVTKKTPAGTYKMLVTGGNDNNYDIIYYYKGGRDYAIVNIAKAPLVITAEDKSVNYMEDIPLFTLLYDGFVNNEDESILDELPQIICDVTSETLPGVYEIILNGGYDNNYEYILDYGTIIINNTNGINAIELDLEENVVYNLNGIRITDTENLTRGIYIINGKKVLVK